MATKVSRKIALVGATGNVGSAILNGLLAAGHDVSAITRAESKTTLPNNVQVHRGDYNDEAFLQSALEGQEVVIAALSFTAYDVQKPLYRAAAKARVPWIVPCEFGSDPNAPLNEHTNLMNDKIQYRKLIEELGVSSWIGVVNDPWLDYVLLHGGLGIDVKNQTASFFDDGNTKANFTTLKRVGESLAAVLGLPEDELAKFKNTWVFFSSFHVTQREIFESALRATGTSEAEWTVSNKPADEVIKHCKEEMSKGNMMASFQLLMALTFADGLGGDYNSKVLDYSKFGLDPENLDAVVKSSLGI